RVVARAMSTARVVPDSCAAVERASNDFRHRRGDVALIAADRFQCRHPSACWSSIGSSLWSGHTGSGARWVPACAGTTTDNLAETARRIDDVDAVEARGRRAVRDRRHLAGLAL